VNKLKIAFFTKNFSSPPFFPLKNLKTSPKKTLKHKKSRPLTYPHTAHSLGTLLRAQKKEE